jgi:purine-nucleoside phosphorylase
MSFFAAAALTLGARLLAEVIVGVHGGFRILGVSIVTDVCIPETLTPVDIKEIIHTANEAEPKMTRLLRR